jgi:hypothetical protein
MYSLAYLLRKRARRFPEHIDGGLQMRQSALVTPDFRNNHIYTAVAHPSFHVSL